MPVRLFRRLAVSLALLTLIVGTSVTPSQAATPGTTPTSSTAAPATKSSATKATKTKKAKKAKKHGCSADLYQGDQRLGPAVLSNSGRVGKELVGYRRTGNLTVAKFLDTYWDGTANGGQGGWIYPKNDGFLSDADDNPIKWTQRLTRGNFVDRFGSEYGAFLAPSGIAYSSRAIPPSSLVSNPAAKCNYSNYRVLRSFKVSAGPIAPWFGQPGRGTQYQLKSDLVPGAPAQLNVMWLISEGYLERVATSGNSKLH